MLEEYLLAALRILSLRAETKRREMLLSFNYFKEVLDLRDGNLASHIKVLEKESYIEIKKEFVGKKPKTTYRVTTKGRAAFEAHLNALEALIKKGK